MEDTQQPTEDFFPIVKFEQSPDTMELDKALLEFQKMGIVIDKGAVNPVFKKKYADLADIQKKINAPLSELGILYSFFIVAENTVQTVVKHVESQQYYKNTIELTPVSRTPQAIGSLITYGKRYSISAILALVIDDSDDDGNDATGLRTDQSQTQAPAPAPQVANLPILSSDNKKDWDRAVLLIQNKRHTLEQIVAAHNIKLEDQAQLLKDSKKPKPKLKVGSKQWNESVAYLFKEGSKIEAIKYKYDLSEQDAADLMTDVKNYTPNENGEVKG